MSQPDTLNPMSTHGLTRRVSGLLVPASAVPAPELTREVWLREEAKLLRRLSTLLRSHRVRAVLVCEKPACRENPAIHVEAAPDGTTVMVCGCTRREWR